MLLTATWHDPGSPLQIEYLPAAMEQIRRRAVEGAKLIPGAGLGMGGLLLGERAGAKVRILDSVELPCSHAFGPSFVLTPEEKIAGRELVESEGRLPVVGWYCSRGRGMLELTGEDLALYRELFPAQWQITFLLKASPEGAVTGAVFFTNDAGEVIKGVEHELGALSAPREPPVAPPALAEQFEPEPAPPTRYLNWILTALVALGIGAAIFEYQNVWSIKAPATQQATPSTEIP